MRTNGLTNRVLLISLVVATAVPAATSGQITEAEGARVSTISQFDTDETYTFSIDASSVSQLDLFVPDSMKAFSLVGIEYTRNGSRTTYWVANFMTKDATGNYEPFRIGSTNWVDQNQQYPQPPSCPWTYDSTLWKCGVDEVFWGEIQISGWDATGGRGILKSTHSLCGITSWRYPPHLMGNPFAFKDEYRNTIPCGETGGRGTDNYIRYYPSHGGSEGLRLRFPGPVESIEVLLVKKKNYALTFNWAVNGDAVASGRPGHGTGRTATSSGAPDVAHGNISRTLMITAASPATVRLLDMNGREVIPVAEVTEGKHAVALPGSLAAGVYHCTVTARGTRSRCTAFSVNLYAGSTGGLRP